jgi:hypothetical protein
MRAKMTAPNQITLPHVVALGLHGVEYLDIEERDGCLVLTPVPRTAADKVRAKLARRGITQKDIDDAVKWARGQQSLP